MKGKMESRSGGKKGKGDMESRSEVRYKRKDGEQE